MHPMVLWAIFAAFELSTDVVIYRIPPFGAGRTVAVVGSTRLAQKLRLKVGEVIAEHSGGDVGDVVQKAIDCLGGAGKVFFKRGNYRLPKPLRIRLPCSLILEGERRRWATSNLIGPLVFEVEKKEVLSHSFLQIRNLNLRGKQVLEIKGIPHVLFSDMGLGPWRAEKKLHIEGPDGLKLFECVEGLSAVFNCRFVMAMDCENTHVRFGPGGLFIGPRLPTSPDGALRTLPLPEGLRPFYPVTVLGAAHEGYHPPYWADGAWLILVHCKAPAGRAGYVESNGGKVLCVGEPLKE